MTGPVPVGSRDEADPAAFATLDLGTATTAAALVGRAGGRALQCRQSALELPDKQRFLRAWPPGGGMLGP